MQPTRFSEWLSPSRASVRSCSLARVEPAWCRAGRTGHSLMFSRHLEGWSLGEVTHRIILHSGNAFANRSTPAFVTCVFSRIQMDFRFFNDSR